MVIKKFTNFHIICENKLSFLPNLYKFLDILNINLQKYTNR